MLASLQTPRVEFENMDVNEFEDMLNVLRPKIKSIAVQYRTDPLGKRAELLGDGELIHTIEKMDLREEEFQSHVSEMVEFYRNPPFLWPRCRGDVARYLGAHIHDKHFHKWFDRMVEKLQAAA